MSEATRNIALQAALAMRGDGATAADVVADALHFDSYLTADVLPKAKLTKPAAEGQKPATKPAEKAPVKAVAKPAAKKPDPLADDDDDSGTELTRDDVKTALQGMLNAGLVDEVTELLAKYKAKNLTKLDEKHYAAVKAEAEAAAEAAGSTDSDDDDSDDE